MTKTNNVVHRIVQADCLEAMSKIPNNSIDFICSDFPYNISNQNWLTMRWNKVVKADFWDWDKFESPEVYLDFVFQVCNEYKRILKPRASMVLFFGYRQAGWVAYELERRWLFTFRSPVVLNKTNPQPQFRKTGFRSCMEMWVWLVNDDGWFKKPKTFNFLSQYKMKNVLNYKIGKDWNKQSWHPTEKPEFLIWGLVEIFTNPWEVVLDSFAGWWTTGVASYKAWRSCISIEKESGFIKMIQARQTRTEKWDRGK